MSSIGAASAAPIPAIGANVVRALVARRARLDARHRCGNTPLDSAPLVS